MVMWAGPLVLNNVQIWCLLHSGQKLKIKLHQNLEDAINTEIWGTVYHSTQQKQQRWKRWRQRSWLWSWPTWLGSRWWTWNWSWWNWRKGNSLAFWSVRDTYSTKCSISNCISKPWIWYPASTTISICTRSPASTTISICTRSPASTTINICTSSPASTTISICTSSPESTTISICTSSPACPWCECTN